MEGTGLYAYGFRYYDPTIARFTSVDPIADQFAFVSGFNYAENRPIDGIDLHGLQWVSMHEWNDPISKGSNLTYKDLWNKQSHARQSSYNKAGVNLDCADFCIQQLVDFAFDNSLPIYFEDYKAEDVDPTFNNNFFGYTDKSGEWVQFESGDAQGLASAIQGSYGASDLFHNRFLTTLTSEASRNGEGGINYKNKEGFNSLQSGSVLGVQWGNGDGFHSQTVSWSTSLNSPKSYGLFNASTGWAGAENPVVTFRQYTLDNFSKMTGSYSNAKKTRLLNWNFDRFSKKANE